jgi:hypothetical protein
MSQQFAMENLLWLLFGAIDCLTLRRFSFRLTFFAIFTDSVNTDFHFVNSAGIGFPQRVGVNHELSGLKQSICPQFLQ